MENTCIANQDTRQKCLELLREAKTDNEKLAGLLLVPKLLSADAHLQLEVCQNAKERDQTDTKEDLSTFKKELLEAIDFSFLNKLLKSSSDTARPTREKIDLQSVALNIIACFGEEGILSESQLVQLTDTINLILNPVADVDSKMEELNLTDKSAMSDVRDAEKNIVELCIERLSEFVRNQQLTFIDQSVLPVLYKFTMRQSDIVAVTNVTSITESLVRSRGYEWMSQSSRLAISAMNLRLIELVEMENIDFSLCEVTARLLNSAETRTLPPKLHPLIDTVMAKLCDALKSRLPVHERQQTLKLLTTFLQMRGIKQLIAVKGNKAALLVIHLCSIEVRMSLEQDDMQRVKLEIEMLCSSFFALEQMIFYMAHEETTLALDSKEILQVHSALHGAVSAIIYFLTCYAQLPADESLQGIVAACIRLLGAWTAEDTDSLLQKYTEVLPVIYNICQGMMDNVDSFKFLVPGLSHLSTDTEQIVNVLIQQLPFITQYVEFCCTKLLSDREEYEHVLVNSCVLILNCNMMPGVEMPLEQTAQLFTSLSHESLKIIGYSKNIDCVVTLLVCTLTVLRSLMALQKEDADDTAEDSLAEWRSSQDSLEFYSKAVDYLIHLPREMNKSNRVRSSDIPEIWLMGIQVMSELMKSCVPLQKLLTSEAIIRDTLKLFEKYSQNVDVAFVLERLLSTMASLGGAKDLFTKVNKKK